MMQFATQLKGHCVESGNNGTSDNLRRGNLHVPCGAPRPMWDSTLDARCLYREAPVHGDELFSTGRVNGHCLVERFFSRT